MIYSILESGKCYGERESTLKAGGVLELGLSTVSQRDMGGPHSGLKEEECSRHHKQQLQRP